MRPTRTRAARPRDEVHAALEAVANNLLCLSVSGLVAASQLVRQFYAHLYSFVFSYLDASSSLPTSHRSRASTASTPSSQAPLQDQLAQPTRRSTTSNQQPSPKRPCAFDACAQNTFLPCPEDLPCPLICTQKAFLPRLALRLRPLNPYFDCSLPHGPQHAKKKKHHKKNITKKNV